MNDPAPGTEQTREIVEQRRPPEPEGFPEARFETPTWLGPDRHPERQAAEGAEPPPVRPRWQAAAVGTKPDVLGAAQWGGARTGRRVAGLLLVVAVVATAASGYLAWSSGSEDAVIAVVCCALLTLVLWGSMAATRPMWVELRGSVLTVHHRNTEDAFDLANPFQLVQVRGAVGSPSWSLRLEREDGTGVVVGSRTVKPTELHPVVLYHRTRAEWDLARRHRAFGR